MKECPKCHRKVSNTTNFCPQCGSQFPTAKSDSAIVTSPPKAVQKLFEDSKSIRVLNRDDAALAFVYIAQYARKDGPECAGVLVDDCEQHFQGIAHLLSQKAVREKHWPPQRGSRLRGYITTTEGGRRAALVIQQRLDQSKDTLKKMLDNLPIKFVRFFRDEVVLGEGEDWYDYRRLNPTDVKEISVNSDNHLCLLNDNKIKKLRDEVMTTLINQGLGEISHSYAATDGGRVDDQVYSLAPEVAGFFYSYLTSGRPFVGPLFDKNLEAKHRLYHQLSDGIKFANKSYFDIANLGPLNMLPRAVLADLQKVFTNLNDIQVVNRDPGRVFIQNTVVFLDVVRQEFFVPLVDHLLSPFTDGNPEIAGQSISIVNTFNETKLIGVDQMDLLFGELDGE